MINYFINLFRSYRERKAIKRSQRLSYSRILNDGSNMSVSRMYDINGVQIRGYQDFKTNLNHPNWFKTKYQHPLEAYYNNK